MTAMPIAVHRIDLKAYTPSANICPLLFASMIRFLLLTPMRLMTSYAAHESRQCRPPLESYTEKRLSLPC